MESLPATGLVSITDMSEHLESSQRPLPRSKCDLLANEINSLVDELQTTKQELFKNRAQLATQIPVVIPEDESYRLAQLFSQLLKSASDSVDCSAAAMYLIDETDEFLNLRSSFGLDSDAPLNDKRLLSTSVADIEALSGHAVVIADRQQAEIWNAPHRCESAVCIPIASSTTVLGTLWVYGKTARDFSESQTNILEIIAGRLASELEREAAVLPQLNKARTLWEDSNVDESIAELASKAVEDQLELDASTEDQLLFGEGALLSTRSPKSVVDPPFEGWSATGSTGVSENEFVEWWVTNDEQIVIVSGNVAGANGATDRGSAVMGLIATRIFLDSCSSWTSPEQVICEVTEILPNLANDCEFRSLTCVMVDPLTGDIHSAHEAFGWESDFDCLVAVCDPKTGESKPVDELMLWMTAGNMLVVAPSVIKKSSLEGLCSPHDIAAAIGEDTPKIILERR